MDKLQELRKIVKCGIHIESNIHKDMYETAEQYYGEYVYDESNHLYDIVGEIDWDKDIWTVHVYPRTPVGFIAGLSNDLDELLDWAIQGAKDY